MHEAAEQKQIRIEPERLSKLAVVLEMLNGIGVLFGLALLWLLEIIRNAFFRMLDAMNVKPRPARRASAFPPGRPRHRNPRRADA